MAFFKIPPVGLFVSAAALLTPCHGFHAQQMQQKSPVRSQSSLMTCSSDDALDRRDLLKGFGAAAGVSLLIGSSQSAFAFDGSGASVAAGYSPVTKAEKKKKFQERVVADVKDFNVLGKAIEKGETQGSAWVNFFILFQRREPDSVGRTYAALADLRGLPTKKKNEFEGGDGLLLANTFTKSGKPPDNTPAVKSFVKVSKSFDAIEAAGKAGDVGAAKKAWAATRELLSQYLSDVELPGDLKDPIYN